MADTSPMSAESFSDDALVARLYELAAELVRGSGEIDREELARIDSVVYRRLEQAYSRDPHHPSSGPLQLDS